jgi:hypothetical protein
LIPETDYEFEIVAVTDTGDTNKSSLWVKTISADADKKERGGSSQGSSGPRPDISILLPPEATVNGMVNLAAKVTGISSVIKVEFFEGEGNLLGTAIPVDKTYNLNWDTLAPVQSGPRVLIAKVTYAGEKQLTSRPLKININQLPMIKEIIPGENPVSGLGYPVELFADAINDGPLSFTWRTLNGTFGTFSDQVDNKVIWRAPSEGGSTYDIEVEVNDGVNPPVKRAININVNNGTASAGLAGGIH